jgi:hypothetical protein
MGLKIFSEQFRDEVLKLNLKTPPDIVLGLVDLSGSALYAAYIDALGKDAIIRTDKASVKLTDPGNVVTDSINPRQKNLNKNLQTPNEIATGIGNITANQSLTQQYLSGRGQPTDINDYNVTNPGDVVSDSVNPRQKNLNRNLQTPPDILANISSGYLSGIGQDTSIGDSAVLNPGSVDDAANIQRPKLFNKNKPINISDPSENDPLYDYLSQGGYTYTSLLQSVGKLTLINDLNIPNAISVSTQSNQTPEVALQLQLQQNRYFPVEINEFESTVLSLKPDAFTKPYVDAYASGVFNYAGPQEYEPSSFLNIQTSINPLAIMTNSADPMSFLLNGGTPPLTNETLLMNIAALELKFNFESRIKRALERKTLGGTNLDEALTNPIAAANIVRNPFGWFNLFERNYEISVASTTLGKAAEFAGSLAGVTNPIAFDFAMSTDDDLAPKCFGNVIEFNSDGEPKSGFAKFVDALLGKQVTRKQDRDGYFIRRTGAGQRYSLFYNVGKNKYQPDYLADQETTLFLGQEELQALRKIGGYFGIGAGETPEGRYYIGNKGKFDDPFYLLQDADGHQVRSNQAIVEAIKNKQYEEPGYSGSDTEGINRPQGVSEYGSVKTHFIWKSSTAQDKAFDFKTNQKSQPVPINIDSTSSLLSVNKYKQAKFRECSILYTTSQLLEKGIQTEFGVFNSPIDQTITKFYDGYDFMSRANATILPKKVERLNKQGDVIGYRYLVPGLDPTGKRSDRELYNEAELCRVWTKIKPYNKVTDLVRYKELIRRERNSVIDRFGNYNIFPSELNVNTGYGRLGDGSGDAVVEYFGERRARKYMFSIENLAWRDYKANNYYGKTDLPACEKGPNGGRVMWFPPYDIKFTDNTTANWTTHQFLGRPEPIYTYNNSERTGTLSWKIVVDHPSILNLLTQKELARLTDGEVDELLAAFWAGCLDFDVFELARIWNQFTQSDIDYFKKVIGDLDLTKSNEKLKPRFEKIITYKQPEGEQTITIDREKPKSLINGDCLFFENDVPLRPNDYDKKTSPIYDTGKIESFDILFKRYYELTKGLDTANNAEATKNKYKSSGIIPPEWMRYNYTVGKDSAENYMESVEANKPKWYGMEKQYQTIEQDLSDPKYKGFDLKITVETHASPLGPDQGTSTYNNILSRRRFISTIKWLITKVMNKGDLGQIYYDNDDPVEVNDWLDTYLEQLYTGTQSIVAFKRDGAKQNTKDTITFVLTEASGIGSTEAIKEIIPNPQTAGPNNNIFYTVDAPDPNSTTKVKYCCFETDALAKKAITGNWIPDVDANHIGTIEAKIDRPYKDVVCGALSIVSSYARRAEVKVEVINKPEEIKKPKEPIAEEQTILVQEESPLTYENVTKREIAQRIINKMITECDYFELLRADTPLMYDSLKQKLKYFQPAFHAITPEGLNARLTFLQQCLRPGETIKRKNGEDSCDASNTAFGKPPICVLRIGDFYHTKIVIDNLNISYEPLVWDLNPEGIGAQPMIADVQLSFKYIGGSGLRKYVDELQNALSFNYYANADVYDDRTFANKDLFERNLINLERSFFDNNTLDLIPIVAAAERIVPADFLDDVPYGTIGIITKKRIPTTPGGNYSMDLFTANAYNQSSIYQPYEIVSENGKFYLRKADNEKDLLTPNTLNGTQAPVTNKTYWEEIKWRNYGEQAFVLEFSNVSKDPNNPDQYLDKSYFNWYEVQYRDLFKQLYETYAEVFNGNTNFNSISDPNTVLMNLILNKNYNKTLTKTNTNNIITGNTTGATQAPGVDLTDPFNEMGLLPISDDIFNDITGTTTGTTNGKYSLFTIFDKEAIERNYVEYGSYDILNKNLSDQMKTAKLSPLKLHLNPQNYMYKIGDGNSLISVGGTFDDFNRFDPGNFTGGYKNNTTKTNAEVAGFYFKNYTDYSQNINEIVSALSQEMAAKIKLNLCHFWHLNQKSKSIFDQYLQNFESTHQKIFTDFLVDKLSEYVGTVTEEKTVTLRDLERNTGKLVSLLNGMSVVLDGYDIKTDETKTYRYEVIPNEYKLKTSAETLFGYDPYYQYKTLSFNNYELLQFADVKIVIDDSELNYGNKLKFLSLGNGTYFFKQISKDTKIQQISGSGYTFNNSFPESIAIKDFVSLSPTTPNFEVTSGITLNSSYDKDAKPGTTTTLNIQPTGNEDKAGSYAEHYPMTYTFEKLNYEFFEFSNKALDVMLNDNFMSKKFDLDIKFDEDNDFYTQVTASGLTSLFYYVGNEKYVNTNIGYYILSSGSTANTVTENIINNINSFIPYTYVVTKSLVQYVPKQNLVNYNTMSGDTINLSGLIDLFFIKVFADLTDADKADLSKRILAEKPTKGITGNEKAKKQQQDKKLVKINNILTSIFTSIKDYVTAANQKTNPLYDEYIKNEENVVKKLNKILIDNETYASFKPSFISEKLLKGGVDDYTVVIKDTYEVKGSSLYNYILFTNTRGLFNIISQSEDPEIIDKATETEFNKYQKELGII